MQIVSSLIFILLTSIGFYLFYKSLVKLKRNIFLGKEINCSDNPLTRWKLMSKIALGQNKMYARPIAAIFHIIVYVGFIIINLELLEIIIDGIFGTHRYFSQVFGYVIYSYFIEILEILAFLVLIAVTVFFVRRNILNIRRFGFDLSGYPKKDANYILIIEFCLMIAFLSMNAAEYYYRVQQGNEIIGFSISKNLFSFFESFSVETLYFIERFAWWFHFVGILFFMNYLYYSKHLHILLAFPSSYFANLNLLGKLNNLESVTNEVKLMLDPNANPYESSNTTTVEKFGASDVFDLNRVQLLNAYTCTECGRCSDVCPANLTGKKLSPRKIMMSTRDRLEEVSKNIDANKGVFVDDGKQLLNDYITKEELWGCTTCNACTDACPILLDPLSIIVDIRRFLVMEQSAAPTELNLMMNNIENNGAPWQFNQQDRANWINE